jgi:hypothetical protein
MDDIRPDIENGTNINLEDLIRGIKSIRVAGGKLIERPVVSKGDARRSKPSRSNVHLEKLRTDALLDTAVERVREIRPFREAMRREECEANSWQRRSF